MPTQTRMLNLSEVARRLDVPYTRLWNLVAQGKLVPDATAGVAHLFQERSIVRVEKALASLFPGRFSRPRPQAKNFLRGRSVSRVLS
jgi:hypothetical protein